MAKQQRSKGGVRRRASAEHLKAYRFTKGVSGNPKGRPRMRPLSERYKMVLEMRLSAADCKRFGLPGKKGLKLGDAIAFALGHAALAGAPRGMVEAIRELGNRTEGVAPTYSEIQQEELSENETNVFAVQFIDSKGSIADPPELPTMSTPQIDTIDLPAHQAEVIPSRKFAGDICIHCNKPIELRVHAIPPRWFHIHNNEFYCAPSIANDVRQAAPTEVKRHDTKTEVSGCAGGGDFALRPQEPTDMR